MESLWLIRPSPIPGELLSSWLRRVSSAHGMPYFSFESLRIPEASSTIGELDFVADRGFFDAVASRSGADPKMLWSMGFAADEGLVHSRLVLGNLEWITPRGMVDERRRWRSMSFCPSCLATDSIPYYRKHWRYAFHP